SVVERGEEQLAEQRRELQVLVEQHEQATADLALRADDLARGEGRLRATLRQLDERQQAVDQAEARAAETRKRRARDAASLTAELDVRGQSLARASDELARRTREHESRSAEVVSTAQRLGEERDAVRAQTEAVNARLDALAREEDSIARERRELEENERRLAD